MKKVLGLVFVLALAATPAMAQKVTVDYAHDFDFNGVKTFQYVDTKESNSKNELMAGRIVDSIKKELREGGLTEVQENPDLFVTYHVTTEELSSFNTTSMGYGGYGGYGPGWGGYGRYGYGGMGGMASSTTYETKYTEGTLLARHRNGDGQVQARETDQAGRKDPHQDRRQVGQDPCRPG
jgi:hypothetical protein